MSLLEQQINIYIYIYIYIYIFFRELNKQKAAIELSFRIVLFSARTNPNLYGLPVSETFPADLRESLVAYKIFCLIFL
jgi:hypothetical protein